MKWFFAIVFGCSLAFAVQTGDKPKIKKTNVQNVDQKAPVTRAEAAAVFARARKAIIAARVANIGPKSTIQVGNQPVTRDEVILEMSKIFQASRKSVKFVPTPARFDPAVLRAGSASSKTALNTLVSWGFVAPVGALAVGPKSNLSVAQFGDAVGFFLARMSDVTHMPSTRWSPYLMPNDGS
jgi:hypothetical protein